MTDIYFSTNPSDYLKVEGLYISEKKPPGAIEGVDINTVGFAGKCVRGPLTPVAITNAGRFVEVFGERDYTADGTGGALIGEVWKALANKKFGAIVVRRVAAADAVKASFTDESAAGGGGTQLLRVDASSVGLWGNNVYYKIAAATDGDANHFNLTARYLGQEVLYENLDISTGNDNLSLKVGSDEGRFIDLTKIASGRPVNTAASTDGAGTDAFRALGQAAISGFTGIAGTEGSLAVTDYNLGMNDLAIEPGVSVCLVPEAVTGSAATFHSNLVTLAATVSDRVFLTWAQAHGASVATEAAQVAAQITTRSDRIWWCYNSPYTLDPKTGAEMQTAPHVWEACILSQTSDDVHPGAEENVPFLAGIKRLTNTSLSRADLIALKAAGISTIERNSDGFQFRSAVTTNLTSGLVEQTRRRMADYLQLSSANRLRHYVKAKNTVANRNSLAGELTAFSEGEIDNRIEAYSIEQTTVNTPLKRGQGIEKVLWRVRLVGHILALVFETEIGASVVIEQAAA